MNRFFKNKIAKKNHGFGLLEIIIAIFILNVGVLATLALATNTINAARISKNRMIAAQLAQEGIELVRFSRDNYVGINPDGSWFGWEDNDYLQDEGNFTISLADTGDCVSASQDLGNNLCVLKTNDSALHKLFYDSDKYIYHNNELVTDNSTIYSRYINLTDISDPASCGSAPTPCGRLVKSVVSWRDLGRDYRVEAKTALFYWKKL